jgi:hypothetical protein
LDALACSRQQSLHLLEARIEHHRPGVLGHLPTDSNAARSSRCKKLKAEIETVTMT